MNILMNKSFNCKLISKEKDKLLNSTKSTLSKLIGKTYLNKFNNSSYIKHPNYISMNQMNKTVLQFNNLKPRIERNFTLIDSQKDYVSQLVNSASTCTEEAFFIADLDKVSQQKAYWDRELPRIKPCYAVKCNTDINIINRLIKDGAGFDCASMEEIKTVLELGGKAEDIIFAHPCKQISHIKYAKKVGINLTTFDNEHELHKMKEFHPDCNLVLRIMVDDTNSVCQFNSKFGCAKPNIDGLLSEAKRLGLNVVGISFHVGSGCFDANAYYGAIKEAKEAYSLAKNDYGFDMKLLDIGGGFPGYDDGSLSLDVLAKKINLAIDEFFEEEKSINKDFKIISEPGRFFAASVFSLAVSITSKRYNKQTNQNMYYVNDGVYGSFNCLLFDHLELPYPEVIKNKYTGFSKSTLVDSIEEKKQLNDDDNKIENNDSLIPSQLWGPTCDSMDCLSKDIQLPDLNINDWLLFKNMGAYTSCAASSFNGFPKSKVLYTSERNDESKYLKKIRKMNDEFTLS